MCQKVYVTFSSNMIADQKKDTQRDCSSLFLIPVTKYLEKSEIPVY